MSKMKYYGPDIRHKIIVSGNRIETILQRRQYLFFWQNVHGTNIHFQIRPNLNIEESVEGQRILPHINPSVMHFMNIGIGSGPLYGELETWDESTFNLEYRLYEIANDYCKSIKIEKKYSNLIEKQFDGI